MIHRNNINGTEKVDLPAANFRFIEAGWPGTISILAILAQHFSIAISAYFVYQMSLALQDSKNPFWLLIAFFVSQFLFPLAARAVLGVSQPQWLIREEARILASFVRSRASRPRAWAHQEGKRLSKSLFSQDLASSQKLYINTLIEALSRVLSFLCNALAVSLLLNNILLVAFTISIGSVILILIGRKAIRQKYAEDTQIARNNLNNGREAFWDNIVLGNAYNSHTWSSDHRMRQRSWENAYRIQEIDLVCWSSAAGLAAVVPVAVAVLFIARGYLMQEDYQGFIIVFMPLLPRIATITEYGVNLVMMLPRLGSASAAYKTNLGLASQVTMIEPKKYMKMDQIKITKISEPRAPLRLSELQELLDGGKPGRFEISASNGKGKSMLLLLLKERLDGRGHLIPAHHGLAFKSATGSTGELVHKQLLELLTQLAPSDVLLLDEWDANLDHSRRRAVDLLLKDLSIRHAVIQASPLPVECD